MRLATRLPATAIEKKIAETPANATKSTNKTPHQLTPFRYKDGSSWTVDKYGRSCVRCTPGAPQAGAVRSESFLSDYFFDAEGSLPYCPSAPFARQVQASRPPLLRMLSLQTGPLLAPLSVWHRPLSVDTCPPMSVQCLSRAPADAAAS